MNLQTIFLQAGEGFNINMLLPVAAIAVMYFFILRPQLTRQKKEKKFQETIKQGTKVVMTSGIHGKITEISSTDNTVVIETGAGKIRFDKSAISMALSKELSK